MPALTIQTPAASTMASIGEHPEALPQKRSYDNFGEDFNNMTEDALAISKRPKVSFNSDIEIRSADQLPGKSFALTSVEIRRAIRKHEAGESEEYSRLKTLFTTNSLDQDAPSAALLGTYLRGFADNANLLKRSCSELVHAILDSDWLGHEDLYVNIYINFLRHLVSLQGGYIHAVLKMLVENFGHLSSSAGSQSDRTLMRRLELQARVHTALRQLLQQTPTASAVLSRVLPSSFPFPTDTKKAHVEYVRNALKVIEYAPELKSDILDLVIDRLVKIDCQVQSDVEDLEFDFDEVLMHNGYAEKALLDTEYHGMEDNSDIESVLSDESLDLEEQRVNGLKAAVGKMDAVLDLLFAFFTPTFAKASSSLDTDMTFSPLLSIFRKIILPAYRSRHSQFLLFHFSQTSSDLVLRFTDTCVAVLKDQTRSSLIRISATAYVASFAARGAHLSHDDVTYVFRSLSLYLEHLRSHHEDSMPASSRAATPSIRKHGAYYATFQALIYIYCFRWRDLLDDFEEYVEDELDVFDGKELSWAPGVKETFERNVSCRLNPLKICAPEVVEEFARISQHLNFLYVYSIIDRNKRLRLSQGVTSSNGIAARETSLSALQGDRMHQLDAYFPFDPYGLPVSKRWLVGDYNEWKGIPGLHDEPSQDAEDSSAHDEPEEDAEEGKILKEGTETPIEEYQIR